MGGGEWRKGVGAAWCAAYTRRDDRQLYIDLTLVSDQHKKSQWKCAHQSVAVWTMASVCNDEIVPQCGADAHNHNFCVSCYHT